jgi:hypothetical protein
MSEPVQPALTGWKCWYASRGMWSAIVGLLASSATLVGYVIKPEYQQHLTDLLTLITIAVCFLGSAYGRFFAKTRIGKPQFHEWLQSLFNKEPE